MGWLRRLMDRLHCGDSTSTPQNKETSPAAISGVQSCPHSDTYIILDTETTGLDAQEEAIIQLTAIKFDCNGNAVGCFDTYLNPGRSIPSRITQLTGITNRMVAHAPTASQIERDFLSFLGNALIVGYNTKFDLRFLQQTFGDAFCDCEYVDVLQVARNLFDLPDYKLETVSSKVGFIPSRQHHNALTDCQAVAAVLHYIGGDLDLWTSRYHVAGTQAQPAFEAGYQPWLEGEQLRKQGKYGEALSRFDEARSKGYCHPWVYTSYAMLYRRCKEYDREIAILQEAIERFNGPESEQFAERQTKAKECKARAQQREVEERDRELKRQKRAEIRRKKEAEKASRPPKEAACRAVAQYLEDGTLVAKFPSVSAAAKAAGVSPKSIRDAANGRQKHAGGFCWRYSDTQLPQPIEE